MAVNTRPLPQGPTVALAGLRAACERLDDARTNYLTGKQPADAISTSLSETLFWVDVLDEHAWKPGGVPNYVQRRRTEQGGTAVGGLSYARNFHTHELITAVQEAYVHAGMQPVIVAVGRPQIIAPRWAIQLQWTPLVELPKRQDKWSKDAMYAGAVELRPIDEPVTNALAWLQGLPW